jgi:hypothetical protein
MSVTIFKDIEESLSREVRRITTHSARTLDKTVLKETYDPLSGELIQVPIEAEYYDSSADAGGVEYPHFFIRLMKSREDRFSGRVVPQYGKWIVTPVKFSPKAFEIVLSGGALIPTLGNEITLEAFQIRKVQVGHIIRLLDGNNKGTYKIAAITINPLGNHSIFVSDVICENLPSFTFDTNIREITFSSEVDLSTVKIGDEFEDSSSNVFNVTAIDSALGKITIDGILVPSSALGSTITRVGDVFSSTDLALVRFLVMDPTKPVLVAGGCSTQASSAYVGVSPAIPLDAYYMIRIDSKTRQNHRDILNRVWEEFNPPRTALPVIVRSALSADELLTVDVTTGGSNTINVSDNTNLNVGDKVFIFDDLGPTKRPDGEGFERPFESVIANKISTNQVVLLDTVPDTYKISNCARIVSNAELKLFMFHFVDHVTKDVEGSQYWVHEFTFWVQFWVDRLEQAKEITAVTDIAADIEEIDTGNILSDE